MVNKCHQKFVAILGFHGLEVNEVNLSETGKSVGHNKDLVSIQSRRRGSVCFIYLKSELKLLASGFYTKYE